MVIPMAKKQNKEIELQKVYEAASGSHISDDQAQRYGKRIDELKAKYGYAAAEVIVEDAKKPDSPLHDYFLWNKDKASYEYWLNQARYLLRSIVIRIVGREESKPIRAYFNVTASQELKEVGIKQIYVGAEDVARNRAYKEEVIAQARAELELWADRYQIYQELSEIVAEIKAFLKKGN